MIMLNYKMEPKLSSICIIMFTLHFVWVYLIFILLQDII